MLGDCGVVMKMRRKYMFRVLIGIVLFIAMWYALCSLTNQVPTYVLVFDGYFSGQAQQAISSFIQANNLFTLVPAVLAARLQDQFPQIRAITIERQSPSAFVRITTVVPLAMINCEQVLVESGVLLPRADFAREQMQHLPTVEIAQDSRMYDQTFKKFVTGLRPEIIDQYDIRFDDQTCVYLHDKKDRAFSLIVRVGQSLGSKLRQRCDYIKQMLKTRGSLKVPVRKRWMADARFENQIIVYPSIGERDNGKKFQ